MTRARYSSSLADFKGVSLASLLAFHARKMCSMTLRVIAVGCGPNVRPRRVLGKA